MKCPNCHCEISSNERICRYCGYEINDARRETVLRDADGLYYKDAAQYYEQNYLREREKNERYRQATLMVLIGAVVLLNFAEVLLLILWK